MSGDGESEQEIYVTTKKLRTAISLSNDSNCKKVARYSYKATCQLIILLEPLIINSIVMQPLVCCDSLPENLSNP